MLPASVEGAPVTITTDKETREYVLHFDGTADQVVHPEFSGGGVSRYAQRLDDGEDAQITAFSGERPALLPEYDPHQRLSLFARADEDGLSPSGCVEPPRRRRWRWTAPR